MLFSSVYLLFFMLLTSPYGSTYVRLTGISWPDRTYQQMVKNNSSWNDLEDQLSTQNTVLVAEIERLEVAKKIGKHYEANQSFHYAFELYARYGPNFLTFYCS
jgi:hypothetical protein